MPQVSSQNWMLEKITSTLGELPASPKVVSAVMGLTTNLNANIEDLGKVLASDQALTAKVLKLSNSSFYGQSKAVSTLREAILILGFYTLRSMVLATSTHSLYKKKGNEKSDQKLWDHSLACAMACRLIGNRIHHPQIEEIFIVGLLHDIGKMILGQKLGAVYDGIVKSVEADQLSFHLIETEKLGFDHADVGLIVLNKWHFPLPLANGVYGHHSPEIDPTESSASIAEVVHFANHLCKKIGVGYHDFSEPDLLSLPLARRMQFTEQMITELTEELRAHYQVEKQLFEES